MARNETDILDDERLEKGHTNRSYSVKAKLLHWGFVFLFAYGIYKQIDNINELEEIALLKFEVFFAAIFVVLLMGRFAYMKKTQKSSLPTETPKLQKLAAKIIHYGMYLSLAGIAFSGLMIGILFWKEVKTGALLDITVGIHEFSVLLSYWLIFIHIAAAMYHRLLKDGVWSSMVPFWTEGSK